MSKKQDQISITLGGRTITGTPIPAEIVFAANGRIAAHMKKVTRNYKAKAAKSKRDIAKTVLNA